jgi:hypothetical protein
MTEEQKPDSGLLEELQTLGQQLSTAVKAMWEGEESRKLRQEIGDGFLELGQQVEAAISTAQESETAKQFGDQVKEAVDRARESDLAAEFEQGLVTGLHELNKGISDFIGSLEPKMPAAEQPAAEGPVTEEAEAETEPEPEA